MQDSVYFDSSVFLALFNHERSESDILELLRELKGKKIRVVTSILTIQEVSVVSYQLGTVAADNHAKVHRIARIESITRDISLTAAKLEAQIIAGYTSKEEKKSDNKRRKFDCFHIATAMNIGCKALYSEDEPMRKRKYSLRIRDVEFFQPQAQTTDLPLFSQLEKNENQEANQQARFKTTNASPA